METNEHRFGDIEHERNLQGKRKNQYESAAKIFAVSMALLLLTVILLGLLGVKGD